MNKSIAFVSTPTLEKWDWRNPEKGIGGSETSHVRMAQELFKRGYPVVSYAPIPDGKDYAADPTGLTWLSNAEYRSNHKVLINYRDPKLFDNLKPKGAKWWFVAQDVDYGSEWTPERLAKVDRYICLCPVHATYTAQKYPELHKSGRIFTSSNGISSDAIRSAISGVKRNPKRIMYASSPDRGLMFILENWFRIKERVPDAEFHVFYGFANYDAIIKHNGESDWRVENKRRLMELLNQPGVVWHDRVGQEELWRNWAESNIWFYPTDFPETSCITSMEAQACGAIPVTTNLWALKQNVLEGYKFDGLPQKSNTVAALMIEKVIHILNNPEVYALDDSNGDWVDNGPYNEQTWEVTPSDREQMIIDAQKAFDWKVIADQWEKWIKADLSVTPFKLKIQKPDNSVKSDPEGIYGTGILPETRRSNKTLVLDPADVSDYRESKSGGIILYRGSTSSAIFSPGISWNTERELPAGIVSKLAITDECSVDLYPSGKHIEQDTGILVESMESF